MHQGPLEELLGKASGVMLVLYCSYKGSIFNIQGTSLEERLLLLISNGGSRAEFADEITVGPAELDDLDLTVGAVIVLSPPLLPTNHSISDIEDTVPHVVSNSRRGREAVAEDCNSSSALVAPSSAQVVVEVEVINCSHDEDEDSC